jgi:hypothetical protein
MLIVQIILGPAIDALADVFVRVMFSVKVVIHPFKRSF